MSRRACAAALDHIEGAQHAPDGGLATLIVMGQLGQRFALNVAVGDLPALAGRAALALTPRRSARTTLLSIHSESRRRGGGISERSAKARSSASVELRPTARLAREHKFVGSLGHSHGARNISA